MPRIDTIVAGIVILILLGSAVVFPKYTKRFFLLIGRFGIRLCIASLGIYLLNWAGELIDFRIAINPITVGIVAILGIPGAIALGILTFIIA